MEDLFSSGGAIAIFFIFLFVIYLVGSFAMYKLAIKANHHSPYWAFIPIFNGIQQLQISKLSLWFYLTLFIPYVGYVFAVYIVYKYLESFGKNSIPMLLFCVLIPIIPYYILAFSEDVKYKY